MRLMACLKPCLRRASPSPPEAVRFYNASDRCKRAKERRQDMMELEIDSLDMQGRGVAHAPACTHFVQGALPGERVRVAHPAGGGQHQVWQLQDILRASSQRVAPPCPHVATCGGCVLQHLDPGAQVAVKQRYLEDSLQRIGRLRPGRILAPVHGTYWAYRYRARLSVYRVPGEGLRIGFKERGSIYVADLRQCLILPGKVSALLEPLRCLLAGLSIAHRIPKIELAMGDAVCVLVLRHLLPLSDEDRDRLRAFGREHDVQWWTQAHGPESAQPLDQVPVGQELAYSLPEYGVRFAYRPTDFTQVNPASNQRLVSQALALLEPQEQDRVLDLFCGLGNFTLPLARRSASVVGIEGSPALLARAHSAALEHGLQERVSFAERNLFEVDPDWWDTLGPVDKVLMDPPRDGARAIAQVLAGLPAERRPQRIVYVSCDPRTLARDAAILVRRGGYVLRAAGVLNLFPHTGHVESMAVFEPV